MSKWKISLWLSLLFTVIANIINHNEIKSMSISMEELFLANALYTLVAWGLIHILIKDVKPLKG